MIRWFMAFTLTCVIEMIIGAVFLVAGLFAASFAYSAGLSILWSALVAFLVFVVALWAVEHFFQLGDRTRNLVFSKFGYTQPAPSWPQKRNPKTKAFLLAFAIAGIITILVAIPIAVLIGPLLGANLVESTFMVVLIEFGLGAPITIGGFMVAEGQAREEFGATPASPGPDAPDFPDRLRERWQSEIDREKTR